MPRDEDDDTLDDGRTEPKPKADPPKPSRFHSRLLKDAERLGFSPEEIEECSNNAELAAIIDREDRKVSAEQTRNRNARRTPEPETPPTPATPPPEPEWTFEGDVSHLDEAVTREIKRLGKQLLKATKSGDKDRIDELKEEIAGLKKENEAFRIARHPLVRRANKILDKYPGLFGTQDEREDDPTGRFAKFATMVNDYIFGTMQEDGTYTGKPEKDIPAAVAVLFPGVKQAGTDARQASQTNGDHVPQPKEKSRVGQWAEAGEPPPTDRNGAAKSGKPGGTKAAVTKVRERKRELGLPITDDDYSPDEGDDDEI